MGCLEPQPLCVVNKMDNSKNASLFHGAQHTFHSAKASFRVWENMKRLAISVSVSDLRKLLIEDSVRYTMSNMFLEEGRGILQRVYSTYSRVDPSNICESLSAGIRENWELSEDDLSGFWCGQFAPDILASMDYLLKKHSAITRGVLV